MGKTSSIANLSKNNAPSILKNYHHENLLDRAIKKDKNVKSIFKSEKNEDQRKLINNILLTILIAGISSVPPAAVGTIIGLLLSSLAIYRNIRTKKSYSVLGAHHGMVISELFDNYLESIGTKNKPVVINSKTFDSYMKSWTPIQDAVSNIPKNLIGKHGLGSVFGSSGAIVDIINEYLGNSSNNSVTIDTVLKDKESFTIPFAIYKKVKGKSKNFATGYRNMWSSITNNKNNLGLLGLLLDAKIGTNIPYTPDTDLDLNEYYAARSLYMVLDKQAEAKAINHYISYPTILKINSRAAEGREWDRFSGQAAMEEFYRYRKGILQSKYANFLRHIKKQYRYATDPYLTSDVKSREMYASLYNLNINSLIKETGVSHSDILAAAFDNDESRLFVNDNHNRISNLFTKTNVEYTNNTKGIGSKNDKIAGVANTANYKNLAYNYNKLANLIRKRSLRRKSLNPVLRNAVGVANTERVVKASYNDNLENLFSNDSHANTENNDNILTEDNINQLVRCHPDNKDKLNGISQLLYQAYNEITNSSVPQGHNVKEVLAHTA